MKTSLFSTIRWAFCVLLLLSACEETDESVPVAADSKAPNTETPNTETPDTETPDNQSSETTLSVDFSVETSGTVSPVVATITNTTNGATSYAWTFEGGNPATSDQKDPGAITFAQVGELKITLKAMNASEKDSVTRTITVKRSSEIITYENIRLGGIDQHDSIGCFFSTKTGKVYREGEASAENGSDIDIAYVAIEGGLRFFETPTEVEKWGLPEIPGAVHSDVINYIKSSDIDFTAEDFEAMEDDTPINQLSIVNDNESFSDETPIVVLFKNNAGQKGVIKVKEISGRRDGYIIFDLKIQKHP